MRVWVVGSGTLLPDSKRGPPAYWVETHHSFLLLDCGAGTLRTMARLGLAWEKVSHLLLTHFHTDHVGEVAPLFFALRNGLHPPRDLPMTVLGPVGLYEHFEALARAHGPHLLDPGFPLEIVELSPGRGWEAGAGDFSVEATGTCHTSDSLGFRIEADGATLGYTGDTGPDPNLGGFFRGCHLLVAECSHPEGREIGTHLTPPGLAALAEVASPDLLVVVHCYPPLEPEEVPSLLVKSGYRGQVIPGRDGLGLDLTVQGVEVLGTRNE